jgi:hypothetical protein
LTSKADEFKRLGYLVRADSSTTIALSTVDGSYPTMPQTGGIRLHG